MKNKPLTKAQATTFAKLQAKRDKAMDDIYAAAPEPFTPFLECFPMAPIGTQWRYEESIKKLRAFEDKMIEQGRGRRNTFGSFCQNY